MPAMFFEDFQPGQTVPSAARTITEHDVVTFAGLSGMESVPTAVIRSCPLSPSFAGDHSALYPGLDPARRDKFQVESRYALTCSGGKRK